MKVALMAGLNLRRMFKDRTNIFFVLIAPFLLILVLGQLYGGGQQLRLGVVAGPGAPSERLAGALASGSRVTVERLGDEGTLREAVERGRLHAGLVIPASYDSGGGTVHHLVRASDIKSHDTGTWIRSIVRQESARGQPSLPVRVTTAGTTPFPEGLNAYAIAAPGLLLMFTFLTSLTAALGLVESRAIGVTARLSAGPTRLRTIIAGEAAGRIAIALFQAVLIMLGSMALFGVSWGDPVGALAVLLVFSLVGGGAGMLLGAAFRTPGPPISLAMVFGLGLPTLGGATIPLESFSEPMRTLAYLTPHAWGYDAFARLVRHGDGLTGVLPQLAVLGTLAVVLFALGTWRLRRALSG
ncbi:ABC transporter permease [Nonomuraea sp. NPDC050394]|uniref:ABC transporter permease n=1 Tax=Nonomuraea sp. NPDC050394 TaxID=3364363 RepID=UPI0037A1EF4D